MPIVINGIVYPEALARHVHARYMRLHSNRRVETAIARYMAAFPDGKAVLSPVPDGRIRVSSPDGRIAFRLEPHLEGTLFKRGPTQP